MIHWVEVTKVLPPQHHIVKRFSLQLNLPVEQREAFHLQNDLKRLCVEKIERELGDILSGLTPAGDTLRFQRLELDLGSVSKRQFGENFIDALKKCITRSFEDKGKLNEHEVLKDIQASSNVIRLSGSQNLEFLFFYFLTHGSFPWSGRQIDWDVFEEKVLALFASPGASSHLDRLESVLTHIPAASDRLLWQFTSGFIEKLNEAILSVKPLLREAESKNAIHWLANRKTARQSNVHPAGKEGDNNILYKAGVAGGLQASDQHQTIINSQKSPPYALEPMLESTDWQHRHGTVSAVQDDLAEAFYIENAGMALLLPFLPHFFADVGLLNDKRMFKGMAAQQKALHVLDYLVFGETDRPESTQVLNKVICNWPLEKPVRRNVKLSKKARSLADALLVHVVAQWGVLKKTSVAGLRHNFLIRNGKLSFHKNHWLLQVEKEGYDAYLLQKLPWTLSIVKFKWAPARMHTEWV